VTNENRRELSRISRSLARLGIFLTETPSSEAPKHFFRPLFPRNPHFPALQSTPKLRQAGRSDPMALSGASRRKQIPSSHNFNGTTFQVMDHDAKGERSDIVGSKVSETIMSNAEGLRAYAALAIWRGLPEEGLIVAKCFYDVIFEYLKRPWNQPMLITKERKPIFGNHYQSIPAAWHLLLALEGLAWDVPAKKLSIRPNLPEAFHGKLKAFLPGSIAWGWLDYSSLEPDCDQKLILTFQRPFELERLGVKNTGRAGVSVTRCGKTVPCTILVQGTREYEICFDPALRLDNTPVEIRVGGAQ
jgi:hypothetical protein